MAQREADGVVALGQLDGLWVRVTWQVWGASAGRVTRAKGRKGGGSNKADGLCERASSRLRKGLAPASCNA
jgi:hypothetical protein